MFEKELPEHTKGYQKNNVNKAYGIIHHEYGLVEANKKIDLTNPSCPPLGKILGNILRQHPLCIPFIASALVPWIYIHQVWHILKMDDSKDKFKFFIDTKEFSVDDFRNMIEPESHKESLEVEKSVDLMIIDEEEEEKLAEDALRRKKGKAFEPTPLSSKPITLRSEHFKKDMDAIPNVVHDTLKKLVPLMVDKTTNDNVKKNLPKVVAEATRLEREKVTADIFAMIAKVVRKEQEHTQLNFHYIY
uniref:Uncharacterized protein n=1 Tax=Tanacetum cinerariifolium TaxID=118510 RepID=A0A6L2MGB3_TANCI|nr:hypothetical protein [Tanacetum cinerariifolium]